MEYSHILDQADQCEDPYMRLVYACKCVFFWISREFNLIAFSIDSYSATYLYGIVASWAISVYYAYARTWKPFNPILGETYEMVNHDGITFISEQVSWDYLVLPLAPF